MSPPEYALLALAGVALSVIVWSFLLRRRDPQDNSRLAFVYLAALIGALAGAKVLYIAAEGWLLLGDEPTETPLLQAWLAGKSILGALLGGYLTVELAKHWLGIRWATGDLFAFIVPLSLVPGRFGCILHGCCPGVVLENSWYTLDDANGIARWPAAPVELLFNVAFLGLVLVARRHRRFEGQLFHVYLLLYGTFRLFHEVLRDTPRILGPFTGYQAAALIVIGLGAVRYRQRARSQQSPG